jgi:RHS repeat-associated protein
LNFGEPKNKEHTFQDQRFDDELGLNWVQFKWRNHDPQIGRFIEIDPLSEKYEYNSTYAFSENKVTGHRELEGLESIDVNMEVRRGISQALPDISAHEQARLMGVYNDAQAKTGVGGVKIGLAVGLFMLNPGVGIAYAVTEITGIPVTPAPQAMSSTLAATTTGTVDDIATVSTIQKNAAQGAAFEQKVGNNLAAAGDTKIAPQITIKADNGVKTKVDFVSTNKSGQIALTEAKSSSTAPLTGNQKVAFPSIAQNGGVVVGNGKPGYPGGTVIPPTQVNIVRPAAVDNTYVRPPIPIIPLPKKEN